MTSLVKSSILQIELTTGELGLSHKIGSTLSLEVFKQRLKDDFYWINVKTSIEICVKLHQDMTHKCPIL